MSENKLILEKNLKQEATCYAIPEGNKAHVIALGGRVTERQDTDYVYCEIESKLLNAAKRLELGIHRTRLRNPKPELLACIKSKFALATLEKEAASENYLLTAPLKVFPDIELLTSTPWYKLKSEKALSLSASCALSEREILQEANAYVKKNLRYGAANKGKNKELLMKLGPFFNEITKQYGAASFSQKKESIVSALVPQLEASKLLLNFDPKEAGEKNLVKASISMGLMQLFFPNEIQEGISSRLGLLFGAGNCGVQIDIALNFLLEHYREQLKYPIVKFLLYKKGYTKTPEKMFDPEQGHTLLVFGNFLTEKDCKKNFWCLDPWNDENPIYETDGWPKKFPGNLKTQWSPDISECEVLFKKAPDTFNIECPQYEITSMEIDALVEKIYKVLVENQNYAQKSVVKKGSLMG